MANPHRLHYRWSQLEADQTGLNVGSPGLPLPKPNRTMQLHPKCEYKCRSQASTLWEYACSPQNELEQARFSPCSHIYQTIHYNTFTKDGGLKLTEIELYFLSQYVTRSTVSQWAVVYIGVGDGARFRYLRDTFFPGLTVIAFDPAPDGAYWTDAVEADAARWSSDGTNFTFHVRNFDVESDVGWIRKELVDKQILFISDIRSGVNELKEVDLETILNKKRRLMTNNVRDDNDLQWRAMQQLSPVGSLVKFKTPDLDARYYDYIPGKVCIQTFTQYCSSEVRLLVQGVPTEKCRYDAWEIHEKMVYHHEHLRGQVYDTGQGYQCRACFDSCFDCSVLLETLSQYAEKNSVDTLHVLDKLIQYHIYMPGWLGDASDIACYAPRSYPSRFWDVVCLVQNGLMTQAIAALELDDEETKMDIDWADVANYIGNQPELAKRIRAILPKPLDCKRLISLLGSLWQPFTRIGTQMNGLSSKRFQRPYLCDDN